ncbi:inositol monophosphatase family protein [Lysinibacter sp. HNR]|uniref:inositol monophosphatase family protein n=1 Tax=Lysinibacter sp. HNR TaxID=3031408 RepID=UPI0024349551|nr:inositol monophosphatase family protein [Lysinibacter sp. HNR]WGD36679.1 inositol monophosphatase family protein [Lysinibacter sp. HNR]
MQDHTEKDHGNVIAHDQDNALGAQLRDIAQAIAMEAGGLITRLRSAGVTVAASKSSEVDIVTEADRAAEELIVKRLQEVRPHDSILGEEGGKTVTGTSEITWVVDPIDGTVNYLYNISAFAVSIAATVEDNNGPDGRTSIAGCVFDPVAGESFSAVRGGGAHLLTVTKQRVQATDRAEQMLRVNSPRSLSLSLVGTGFGYTPEKRRSQAETLLTLLPWVRDIRRAGSAALDLCSVAAGRLDAYYESGLQPWDYAAGLLIAQESGATVWGRDKSSPGTDLLIASAPSIIEPLHAIVS